MKRPSPRQLVVAGVIAASVVAGLAIAARVWRRHLPGTFTTREVDGGAIDPWIDSPLGPSDTDTNETPAVRRFTSWVSTVKDPRDRIAAAEAARRPVVEALFRDAGVAFPPADMLLRAFKRERRLELWASSRPGAPLTHVTTYAICRASGRLGPKRREGDGQVPEGFYTIADVNPASHYHLAMLVNYPNWSDRLLSDREHPGNQIMIHGRCASVGCLAMSDERIEEIWVAATAFRRVGGVVQVHIFPTRDMEGLLASDEQPEDHAFWSNLKIGFDLFEKQKRVPVVRVDATGRYRFR